MAKIIIWENWFFLFIIENTIGIAYPSGPGTPGPPKHINYYALGGGGQDCNFEELDLLLYR